MSHKLHGGFVKVVKGVRIRCECFVNVSCRCCVGFVVV